MEQTPKMRKAFSKTLPLVLGLATLAGPGYAQDAAPEETSELKQALTGGRTWINLRLRAESVDQDPFTKDALATTLRTVLGYETADYNGFKALLEFEDVAPIGTENYNSTTNGNVGRPVIADPDGTEVNQLYLSYKANEHLSASLGRREIILGNARYVGNVGWRQNHQSFDSVVAGYTGIPNTTITYAFIHNINRIFGADHPLGQTRSRSHALDIRHQVDGLGEIAAYAILLDVGKNGLKGVNTDTYGIRFSGKQALSDDLDLLYTAEYADQSDGDGNPNRIDATYYLGELGVGFAGATLKLSQEQLGENSEGGAGSGFSTPLATLHKFNGFADKFLGTPTAGLTDTYITLSGKVAGVKCAAIYHQFDADSGSADYGDELDFVATYPLTKSLTIGAKYASFSRDSSAPAAFQDTDKIMGWLSYSLL